MTAMKINQYFISLRDRHVGKLFIGGIILVVAALLLGGILGEPDIPIHASTKILFDSLHLDPLIATPHNALVLGEINHTQFIWVTILASRESSRMQARAVYAIILAGLFSMLASRSGPSGFWTALIVLATAFLMYGIDVQYEDLNSRHKAADLVVGIATDTLTNRDASTDSVWFALKYDRLSRSIELARKDRFCRKVHTAIRPGLEQYAYYFVPGLVLWIFMYVNVIKYWRTGEKQNGPG